MYPLHVERAGLGLIETLRVREGRIPFLEHHLARLARSLAELRLPVPDEDVEALVQRAHADADDAVVRLEARDGRLSIAVRAVPTVEPPRVITAGTPHTGYPHKTTARDMFERAAAEAWAAGADEALLLTRGRLVAEATVWSVYWWEGDVLHTPALGLRILPGVARARITELVTVVEGWWPRDALAGRSLFLANAVRGIVEVAELDREPVPSDHRTRDLARKFWTA